LPAINAIVIFYSLLKYGQDGQRAKLLDENGQLCAIFTTIIKNTNPKG